MGKHIATNRIRPEDFCEPTVKNRLDESDFLDKEDTYVPKHAKRPDDYKTPYCPPEPYYPNEITEPVPGDGLQPPIPGDDGTPSLPNDYEFPQKLPGNDWSSNLPDDYKFEDKGGKTGGYWDTYILHLMGDCNGDDPAIVKLGTCMKKLDEDPNDFMQEEVYMGILISKFLNNYNIHPENDKQNDNPDYLTRVGTKMHELHETESTWQQRKEKLWKYMMELLVDNKILSEDELF